VDHFLVAKLVKFSFAVEDVGNTSAHTGSKVLPGLSKNNHTSAGHVLTGVVADTFYHGVNAGIPYTETFAGLSSDVSLPARRAIEGHVANDDVFFRNKRCALIRIHNELSSGKSLSEVVVRLTHKPESDTGGYECAEAVSGRAGELDLSGIFRKSLRLVLFRYFVGQHCARSPVDIADRKFHADAFTAFERRLCTADQFAIQHFFQFEVLFDLLVNADVVAQRLAIQDRRQVELLQLPVIQRMAHAKDVGASDHFINLAESKFGHDLPQVFGEEPEEVYHVIGIACEKPAQRLVLRGDAYRTSIQVTLAHHDAPFHDQSRGGNAPFFGSQ